MQRAADEWAARRADACARAHPWDLESSKRPLSRESRTHSSSRPNAPGIARSAKVCTRRSSLFLLAALPLALIFALFLLLKARLGQLLGATETDGRCVYY